MPPPHAFEHASDTCRSQPEAALFPDFRRAACMLLLALCVVGATSSSADPQRARQLVSEAVRCTASDAPRSRCLALLDQAVALDPLSARALNYRGVVMSTAGYGPAKSLAAFAQSLAVDPTSAEVCSNAGVALERVGRLEEAMATQEHAVDLNPLFANALIGRCRLMTTLRRKPARVLDCYTRALAVEPRHAASMVNRANTMVQVGADQRDVLAQVDAALALDDQLAIAHANRGVALAKLGGDIHEVTPRSPPRRAQVHAPNLAAPCSLRAQPSR